MNNKKIFIVLFAILYLCVGLVSTIHAVSFFGLANTFILGIILAITFEIGQAAVLFNLLTSPKQRKKFMPWALMCILTLVQVMGNIFSSYKYLITNSNEDLKYFKEPIFVWTDLPDNVTTVIVTYIVGAILPIVALCLTEMVTSYLQEDEEKQQSITAEEKDNIVKDIQHEEVKQEKLTETVTTQLPTEIPTESPTETPTETVTELPTKQVEEEIEDVIIDDEDNTIYDVDIKPTPVPTEIINENEFIVSDETKQTVNELMDGNVKTDLNNKKSHFINI